jgi:hypothetical protein
LLVATGFGETTIQPLDRAYPFGYAGNELVILLLDQCRVLLVDCDARLLIFKILKFDKLISLDSQPLLFLPSCESAEPAEVTKKMSDVKFILVIGELCS